MKYRRRTLALAMLCTGLAVPSPGPAQSTNTPAKGRLLVAREGLADPNFSRTVVLLLDYGEFGASGVVLNRPSPFRLEQLLPDLDWSALAGEPIYFGGPVAVTRAVMLFATDRQHAQESPVVGAVHVGWDLELLARMVTEPEKSDRFRVFAGHAGWAAGQLEAEIEQRGWYVFPATEADIFSEGGEQLWESFIRRTRARIAKRRLRSPEAERRTPAE
jgi:putative transcriptional regulator